MMVGVSAMENGILKVPKSEKGRKKEALDGNQSLERWIRS
jgi:hypothetical protein